MPSNMELDDVRDDVDDITSEGDDGSTNQDEQGRQTTGNWQSDPKYRELQSKQDRMLAQEKKARERAEAAAYQASQRVSQMEQRLQQLEMRGLEGEELLVAQNRLLQAQLQEVARQRDLDAFAIQRQRDLDDIVRATGVPIEEIEDAPNVHAAWQKGFEWREKETGVRSSRAQREAEIERIADDRVDMGAGKPTGKSSAWQTKYDKARENYEFTEALEIMADAERRGVTIREW